MTSDIRSYEVNAKSTDVFGRVLCSARHHHFVVDGPVQNGCPGEAVTPAELFLGGVVTCAVELTQVIGRAQDIPLSRVSASITGEMDRNRPAHPEYAIFNAVRLDFQMSGVTQEQAETLVEAFKRR
jgi:uncharacterized OsmC-like protein